MKNVTMFGWAHWYLNLLHCWGVSILQLGCKIIECEICFKTITIPTTLVPIAALELDEQNLGKFWLEKAGDSLQKIVSDCGISCHKFEILVTANENNDQIDA